MGSRRELSKSYKQAKLHGGVYTVTNTVSGRYLIGHALNPASVRNRFAFARATGSPFDYKLREDWSRLGADAFRLDVLEELEQGPNQSEAAFRDDLATLEQLRRADLNPAPEY
jgi:hypothetical protein